MKSRDERGLQTQRGPKRREARGRQVQQGIGIGLRWRKSAEQVRPSLLPNRLCVVNPLEFSLWMVRIGEDMGRLQRQHSDPNLRNLQTGQLLIHANAAHLVLSLGPRDAPAAPGPVGQEASSQV